jgi:hypothetical protein
MKLNRLLSSVLPQLLLLVGLVGLASPPALFAQRVERERQETLLPTGGVVEISAALRGRLGLFPEVEGFERARLFLRDDGGAVLELESRIGGQLIRERRLLTAGELESLRQDLATRLDQLGAQALGTREGRGGLVLGHTLLGVGFHGWAVPVAMDVSSGQAAVAAYLLTAGASFYLPYALTRDRGVSEVHRNLSLYGGTRGIVSGLFAGDIVAGNRYDGDETFRARLGGGVVLGALGGFAGFQAVDRWNPTLGTAELWAAFGDAGLAAGAAVAYLAGPYQTETVVFDEPWGSYAEDRVRNRKLGHAITLAGQGVGLATGAWLGSRRDYETGDVSVLRSATILGVQTGATLAALSDTDQSEVAVASMLAGGILGTVGGDRWVGPRGLGTGEGLLVNAGHLAGSATALGITYLLVSEVDGNEKVMLTASTLGGWLGAGLVWRAVSDGAPRRPDRTGRLAQALERSGVEFHPSGILAGSLPRARGVGPQGPDPRHEPPTWLTIRF